MAAAAAGMIMTKELSDIEHAYANVFTLPFVNIKIRLGSIRSQLCHQQELVHCNHRPVVVSVITQIGRIVVDANSMNCRAFGDQTLVGSGSKSRREISRMRVEREPQC